MKPSEIPLEQLELPTQVRPLLDSITEPPTETKDASVVRKQETEESMAGNAGLSPEKKAMANRSIEAGLRRDAQSGQKRSEWRKEPAEVIGRHPSWVTNRIKSHHSQRLAA